MSIDFRVRPPVESYRTAEFYTNFQDVEQRSARFGTQISQCAKTFSLESLLEEMDEADVGQAVVPIRKGCGGDNMDLVRLLERYTDRFIGLAGIAPLMGVEAALEEIGRYVTDGPCRGIALEPAFDPERWHVDDERVFPIYERCSREGIPVAMTFGGIFTPGLGYYAPLELDRVAAAFPDMNIALCHGGWPYVTEICQIAFNRRNVYLAPDMYMINAPGSRDFIAAANGILYDRILFASAAPIISIRDAARHYRNCGIVPRSLPYVMEDNAKRFLGL